MADEKMRYCEKCGRTFKETEFYGSNNLDKYPDGRLNQCKKCATMHIDNFDPSTYTWLIQECDIPYIPDEWNALLAKFGKDKSKLTGLSIFGRYVSKMKLKQFKDFRWKDNEFIQDMRRANTQEMMKAQGYDAAEIATILEYKDKNANFAVAPPPDIADTFLVEAQTAAMDTTVDDLDLTDEDRTYLRIKWGKHYRADEWVRLEQLYEDMMQSYDIQSAGDKNTLVLACKASLKANQLMDIGDIDGAQKATKMYDALMKSGKWTAQQNKAEKGEYVDSISELVAICETDGFIPRYYTDGPQDKVDRVIQDTQEYVRTLITEEMHLGSLIERAVKQIEEDADRDALLDDTDISEDDTFEESLFDQPERFLEDQDFMDFKDFEDEEIAADLEALLEGAEE